MRIKAVDPDSPLFGYVRPGYRVLSVNGQPVLDSIDWRFKTTDDWVRVKFADGKGKEIKYQFEGSYPGDLGLTLDDGRILVCRNNCIFCFVHQQPKGMRRALYIKDEDYRLSFTHGNFITLTNVTGNEIKRIIEQRLSPLYVSVHTTNDRLRRQMLGNAKIPPIIPQLTELTQNGITIHAQVVLCPELNDGSELDRTVEELAALYPGLSSLAVVPVGLTRYRQNLPRLRRYTALEAKSIVEYVQRRQRDFLGRLGSRFVWVADEFYVESGKPLPSHASYEDMPQFENGVGMMREFLTRFNRRRSHLRGLNSRKRVLFLTGFSALPFLRLEVLPYLKKRMNLKLDIQAVENRFWGSSVTVSGLLTGKDLLGHAREMVSKYDTLVLPPNCLNNDELFLDDMSLTQFRNKLKKDVFVGSYNLTETVREVFS